MVMKTITISKNAEMDARRLALLVQTAGGFEADVYLKSGARRVNAKSLMGTMALRMIGGEEITVSASGTDENEALKKLSDFLGE